MKLLLIEDYLPLQKSLARGLREAGYALDVTGDGKEGLWLACGNEYDVIILDLMLPGLDGLSLLTRLRSAGKKTHVLILTAKDALADRVRGLDSGADDYLVKPFAFDELLARVRSLVRRGYQEKNPLLKIGPLRIDTSAHSVHCRGQSVPLTAREYTLLEYLAMRAGQIVSRSEIWEHLYEFNDDATSNVVDVYVGYLRRKLDAPDTASLIRTVRGAGYILEATQ
ncbi:MAG: response regulator transcription factor [Planctomycetaceae bacterium]|nr:response regulator transcription factor [Planctomycetaceae bacterium]